MDAASAGETTGNARLVSGAGAGLAWWRSALSALAIPVAPLFRMVLVVVVMAAGSP
jgi:hypothetical protein